MENSNKMKIWFFENVNQRRSIIQSDQEKKKNVGLWRKIKIIKLKQKWRNHNTQHRNKKGIKDYCKQLYFTKMDNVEEIEKFLGKTNHS